MNADWFYSVGDSRQGPVTELDLKGLAADGRLKPTDLVWKDGMPDWVEARTVPVLFPAPNVEALAEPYADRPSRRGRDDLDDDRPGRRGRDEFDDDRPSRRGRRDDYDPDDDRPRVRRREDNDDRYEDEYERPRRKKREKPGQVQAIGIMMLVGGIIGLVLMLAYLPTCFILVWPGFYFEIVVGILLIIRGVNMMNQDDQGPPRTLAILQIICIANLDVINCVLGIVSIIMLNDPTVEEYYRKRGF